MIAMNQKLQWILQKASQKYNTEAENKGTDKAMDKKELKKQIITSPVKAKLMTVLAPLMIMLWGMQRSWFKFNQQDNIWRYTIEIPG